MKTEKTRASNGIGSPLVEAAESAPMVSPVVASDCLAAPPHGEANPSFSAAW